MDRSTNYDPYQDISPLNNTGTHNHRYDDSHYNSRDANGHHTGEKEKDNGHYTEVQPLDPASSDADQPKELRSKPALTTGTEAADFKVINWPDGPRFVKHSIMIDVLTFLLDAILVLTALLFLALAILTLRFADEPADSALANSLEQAMKLGPTIYPILFAALLGRALKGIGRWRAERGTRVTNLWPLFNNKTIFDAFISQWHLAQFNMVASAILLLWALSPLGGQASLRLMYKTNITTSFDHDLRYMDTGVLGNIFTNEGFINSNDISLNSQGLPLTMPALYQASLLQSLDVKKSPLDGWGNIKIPRIDNLDESLADVDGWVNITTPNSVEAYTALLGLPIINVPVVGDVEFTVESVYVALDRPKEVSFGPERWYSGNFSAYQYTGLNLTCLDCVNYLHNPADNPYSLFTFRKNLLYGEPFEQPNATVMANSTISGRRSIRFDEGTKGLTLVDKSGTATAIFEVSQHFVETAIRCSSGNCAATRVRRSTTDQRDQDVTSFDLWGTFALDMITTISNAVAITVSSPSELFMNDSNSSPVKVGQQAQESNMVNLTMIDPQLLADRASMLLNTALQVFMAPGGFNGDLPTSNMTMYGPPHIPANGLNITIMEYNSSLTAPLQIDTSELLAIPIMMKAPFIAANTTAKVTEFLEVIKPDYGWVVVLILSSSALVTIGIAGMWLGRHVKAPDVFDPLMGLTYNNPYLNIPGHHSTLSASERARLLANLTVRLGDVHPYDEMGQISLGQTAEVKRLVKGRLYE